MLKWEQERNVFLRKQKGETGSELFCKMETTEKLSGRKARKDGERREMRQGESERKIPCGGGS